MTAVPYKRQDHPILDAVLIVLVLFLVLYALCGMVRGEPARVAPSAFTELSCGYADASEGKVITLWDYEAGTDSWLLKGVVPDLLALSAQYQPNGLYFIHAVDEHGRDWEIQTRRFKYNF